MMNQEARRILLLESARDVLRMDQAGMLQGDGAVRLCLAPAPAVELERQGLGFCFPHQFLPSAEIQGELEGNWERLHQLLATMDERVPYGWTVASWLRVLIDTCMEKIAHLDAVLQTYKPAELAFVETRDRGFDFRLTFAEQESLYARLLPSVLAARYPDVQIVSLPPKSVAVARRPTLSASRLRQAVAPRYHALRFRLKGTFRRRPKGAALCVAESAHGMARAAYQLADRHRVFHWEPRSAYSLPPDVRLAAPLLLCRNMLALRRWRRHCRAAWEEWQSDPKVRGLFVHRGVDFFEVVESRLQYLFTEVFPHLYVLDHEARRFFARQEVKCLVSSRFSRPYSYALAIAARSVGVPVVTVQHSAYGYWDWGLLKYTDAIMSDYKLVGGEGVARYMESVERAGCAPVVTGLPAFDALVGRPQDTSEGESRRPRVVYALASYVKNAIHYTHSRMALTEYFEVNRRVLDVLGRHPEADVLVRPHPMEWFEENVGGLGQWLERQGWEHVQFAKGGTTLEAMQHADIVIIDSPTTVFLHAATTRARVLVLNKSLAITGEGVAAIRTRAIYEDDLDRFLDILDKELSKGEPASGEGADDTFLRLYATHLNDGKALQRAVMAMLKVLEGGDPSRSSGATGTNEPLAQQ